MDARELVSPDITDDNFKWRFAMENMRPKLDIQGPGVGSLLYAMNPATSELGLKQMDSELNQQLAANENFDKRGDRALKFMEERVQEDIARKKMGSVDAGHANSLLSNYTQALQSGDATAIAIAEDRIRQTFPNADAIMNQSKEQAALGKVQDDAYLELGSMLPDKWNNGSERKAYIDKVQNAIDNGLVTRKNGFELIGKANQTSDWGTINKNTHKQAQIGASAGRNVKKKENDLVQQKYKELKAKYPSISDAEAWDRALEVAGVK
jgi:hypothetical protein